MTWSPTATRPWKAARTVEPSCRAGVAVVGVGPRGQLGGVEDHGVAVTGAVHVAQGGRGAVARAGRGLALVVDIGGGPQACPVGAVAVSFRLIR